MPTLSVKTRLIVILTAVLCMALLATSVANYRVSYNAIHDELISSSLPLTREIIYSQIHSDLMRPMFVASLMANDAFVKEWALAGEADAARIALYLREIRSKYGFKDAYFVSQNSRNHYQSEGLTKTLSPEDDRDSWFFRFIAKNREYDLAVAPDETTDDRLTVFINYRVETPDGRLIGVAGVGQRMDSTADLLQSYLQRYGRRVTLADASGTILLTPVPRQSAARKIQRMPGYAPLSERILSGGSTPLDLDFVRDGRRVLLTTRYMPDLGWYLVVEQGEGRLVSSLRSNLVHNIAIGTVAIGVVLIVVILTVNHFQSRLERLATRDELTGVANRRAFEAHFEKAVYQHNRSDSPFCILLIDLDGFKAVNDTCGHVEGDLFLKSVADEMVSQIRQTDVLARWGGDEFIVLVADDQAQASAVAERIRNVVSRGGAEAGVPGRNDARRAVTASIGGAQYRRGDTLDTVTRRADRALYVVKSIGGDGVQIVADEPTQ
jgi:diguanylate cyclase (GGDEF)-like protein